MRSNSSLVSRRRFVAWTAAAVSGAGLLRRSVLAAPAPAAGAGRRYRAAVIGHTGRGNYGHGLDVLFNPRPDIEVAAVADPDAAGRAKAAERARAKRQYADYREMLEQEKPQLVSVAPRWTDQHHAMILAALKAGAHVISEKPFTATLAEADELLAAADKGGLKIAVAHQMRLAPSVLFLKQQLDRGLIGELLEIRAHGKQDSRAGLEDTIVLGTHLFDLIRFFAGDPRWCSARVLEDGREITRQDARKAAEDIGPIAGNDVAAQFDCSQRVVATFTSRAAYRQTAGHWGLELIGSKGSARVLADVFPNVFVYRGGDWSDQGHQGEWRRMDGDPALTLSAEQKGFDAANRRVVNDWIEAIESGREPACSGRAAMKAVEMALAILAAGLARERVAIPLKNREHPLA